jgi:hypothetical protein
MSRSDFGAQLFGEHIAGMAKHSLGDQIGARRHLEQVLTHYAPTYHGGDLIRLQDIIRFQIDGEVSARLCPGLLICGRRTKISPQAALSSETSWLLQPTAV